jgi:hypothetical protein
MGMFSQSVQENGLVGSLVNRLSNAPNGLLGQLFGGGMPA